MFVLLKDAHIFKVCQTETEVCQQGSECDTVYEVSNATKPFKRDDLLTELKKNIAWLGSDRAGPGTTPNPPSANEEV